MKSFMFHKKLNAFTLLELLVGMIVSGIVLTATFSAYKIVTGQYETYRNRSAAVSELSFFVSQMQSDFSNSLRVVRRPGNKIQLQSEKRTVEYYFTEKYILRNDLLRIDTFKVSVTGIETLWKAEKVNSEEDAVDELHIQMNYEGKREEKIYLKTVDPKSEIDREDLNSFH
jgi:prepilin-type N-terminal cleavage/methylation domain-containing protein